MSRPSHGFTLVELLIVVTILGILAGVILPSISARSGEAQEAQVRASLKAIREAISRYHAEHDGVYPGYPPGGGSATQARLRRHLYEQSKKGGQSDAIGSLTHPYGPYLRYPVAVNPLNGQSNVRMIADGAALPAPNDGRGWIYKAQTGEFRMNSTGTAPSGIPWGDL